MDSFSIDGVDDGQSRVPVIQSSIGQDHGGRGAQAKASQGSAFVGVVR
jgi:hypothetical protein